MKKIKKTNILKILKSYIPLAVLLVIFCLICIPTLNRPMWFDEAYSSYLVKGDMGQITKMTALDVHPPFYYWCLRAWTLIFGRSVIGMRSLSVLFSVLAIICLYILLKRWTKNNKSALFLTSLFAACPFLIYYSGEMRMYSLSCLIIIFGTLILDVALEKNKKIYWLLYSLTISVALYTHYFVALGFAAHFIYLIFYFKKHGFNKNLIWVYILAVIMYIPWIPILFNQVADVETGYWPYPVTPMTLIRFFSVSFVYFEGIESDPFHLVVTVIMILSLLAMALKNVDKMGESTKNKTFLIALMTFVPPVILMGISIVGQSVYVERYITCAIALVWVLYGVFMLTMKYTQPIRYCFSLLLLVFCICLGIKNVYKLIPEVDPFADITTFINNTDKENTPIVYYDSDAGTMHLSIYETESHPIYIYRIDPSWGASAPIVEYGNNYIQDFDKFREETDAFWYVYSDRWSKVLADKDIGDDFIPETDYNTEGFIAIRYVKKQK